MNNFLIQLFISILVLCCTGSTDCVEAASNTNSLQGVECVTVPSGQIDTIHDNTLPATLFHVAVNLPFRRRK